MSTLLIKKSLEEGKFATDAINEVNKQGVVSLEKQFVSADRISFLNIIQFMFITAYTGLFWIVSL